MAEVKINGEMIPTHHAVAAKVEELQIRLGMQHHLFLVAMDRAEKAEAIAMEARKVLDAQKNDMAATAFAALANALNP